MKRRIIVKGKVFEEGFFGTIGVKDWTIVTHDDNRAMWRKYRPLVGKKVRIVLEVI